MQEFLSACRADILAKGGVSTCLNVLIRTPSEDAPIADVVNSLLSSLAEGSDDVTHQVIVRKRLPSACQSDVPLFQVEVREEGIQDYLMAHEDSAAYFFVGSSAAICYSCNVQDGKRLLHWAVQFGEIEALETILDGHPNLEARDERGNTALHLAAAAGHM